MTNNSVVSALLAARFDYLGAINDMDLDYMELVDGDWYLGVICCENMILAFNNSIGWGLDCHGEADIENRWNNTKKLIRTSLKQLPLAA